MAHILIVDDQMEVRLALRVILEESGYEVSELDDGVHLVQTVVETRPDVVLLDVGMPRKNGFDALREIKADSRTSDVPVIMVTAKGRTEDLARARSLGARDYISKPWEEGEIELRVDWLLQAEALQRAS